MIIKMKLIFLLAITINLLSESHGDKMCLVPCSEWCPANPAMATTMSSNNEGADNLSGASSGSSPQIESSTQQNVDESSIGMNCSKLFGTCSQDSDCCSSFCLPGWNHCLFNATAHLLPLFKKCLDVSKQCVYNFECCSGLCDPVTGLCQEHRVTIHPPYWTTQANCAAELEPCQIDSHCCSNKCDTTVGQCTKSVSGLDSSATTCLFGDLQCTHNSECCSEICDLETGTCQLYNEFDWTPLPNCKFYLNPCKINSDCCSNICDATDLNLATGICQGGKSANRIVITSIPTTTSSLSVTNSSPCLQNNLTCSNSHECCSGICDSTLKSCGKKSENIELTTSIKIVHSTSSDNNTTDKAENPSISSAKVDKTGSWKTGEERIGNVTKITASHRVSSTSTNGTDNSKNGSYSVTSKHRVVTTTTSTSVFNGTSGSKQDRTSSSSNCLQDSVPCVFDGACCSGHCSKISSTCQILSSGSPEYRVTTSSSVTVSNILSEVGNDETSSNRNGSDITTGTEQSIINATAVPVGYTTDLTTPLEKRNQTATASLEHHIPMKSSQHEETVVTTRLSHQESSVTAPSKKSEITTPSSSRLESSEEIPSSVAEVTTLSQSNHSSTLTTPSTASVITTESPSKQQGSEATSSTIAVLNFPSTNYENTVTTPSSVAVILSPKQHIEYKQSPAVNAATTIAPHCTQNSLMCEEDSDCCSGFCNKSSWVCNTSPLCLPGLIKCTADSDCCSLQCGLDKLCTVAVTSAIITSEAEETGSAPQETCLKNLSPVITFVYTFLIILITTIISFVAYKTYCYRKKKQA